MPAKKQTHICDEKCIHDDVMRRIHSEHLTMRPRVFFLAGSLLVGAGMAGAVIMSVFFTHVTLYRLRYDAALEYLDFGKSGMQPFMQVFPWVPFLIAVGGLCGGSYLLREYEISYKHRYTRLLLAFIALLLTLGYLLDRSGVNRHMGRVRTLHRFYQPHEHRPFIYGTVERVDGTTAYIRTPYNNMVALQLQSRPHGTPLKPGASVRAIGIWRGEVFEIQRILIR